MSSRRTIYGASSSVDACRVGRCSATTPAELAPPQGILARSCPLPQDPNDVPPPRPPPSEFDLIARYFAPLSRALPGAYGLEDDVAVIAPAAGHELVVKSDAIVGGIDFPDDARPELIARKALRVNLSDLAAKGAIPRAYLLDLIVPRSIDEAWIAAFAGGLARDQAEYGVHLAGGDTSSTPGPIVVAVSAFGEAPIGRVIRRGGAKPDDDLYVTGTIGDAALGLLVLRGDLPSLSAKSADWLTARYRLPQPRVSLGPRLLGVATAAIDVSDGLVADLRHLSAVSRLAAEVEARAIPCSPAAREAIASDSARLAVALTGGDDYEILFTAPAAAAARIAELSRSAAVEITRIGRMSLPGPGDAPRIAVRDELGHPLHFASEGFRHFAGET